MDQAPEPQAANTSEATNVFKFPYTDAKPRLERYSFNDQLFIGQHYEAFRMLIQSREFNKTYSQLKYMAGNFAGLVSKLAADMLFSEAIKIEYESEQLQKWAEALIYQNKLHVQNYESALANSRHGDAIYKLRIGKLKPGDETYTVIIEDITPAIYFPTINPSNVRAEPETKELAWTVNIGNKTYLRKEIHTPGQIVNELWLLESDQIKQQVSLDLLDQPDLLEVEDTKIQNSLIVHIPNWRDGSRYFGYDDYGDLLSLFYGLNNRMTKTENILDKHSDPILALPEGVLDEDGKVRKESFNMFEIPSDGTTAAKPEYIVWNASLDSSFKQIDKIVEMMYMFSETTPDAFGMGQGQADSGRALRLKLLRTIAKTARKRLYYDQALKELLQTAQELALAHGVGVWDETKADYSFKAPSDKQMPDIQWQDGLPIDDREQAEIEEIRLRSENTTIEDSIKRMDGVDDKAASAKAKEILDRQTVPMPSTAPVMLPDSPASVAPKPKVPPVVKGI